MPLTAFFLLTDMLNFALIHGNLVLNYTHYKWQKIQASFQIASLFQIRLHCYMQTSPASEIT